MDICIAYNTIEVVAILANMYEFTAAVTAWAHKWLSDEESYLFSYAFKW